MEDMLTFNYVMVLSILSVCLTFVPVLLCRVTLCKTPGCFLPSLSNPGNSYSQNFKQKKEELTSRLYQLYNSSVFDNKVFLCFHVFLLWSLGQMSSTTHACIFSILWLTAPGQYAGDLE